MNNQQKEVWRRTREKGRTKYVLLHGVIKLGAIFVIGMYLFDIIFEIAWSYWFNIPYKEPSIHWESRILTGIVFGLVIGLSTWSAKEKDYINSENN